ncbi:MAG: xanthine dehydrogenase family protein subunit M [Chloroflexi bacterium]|nr:xanthine dehydrogenase family protein subunit M [Chloroflexota bacterium]
MRPFDYHAPSNVPDALELLRTHGSDAVVMAGGTSLMLLMQQGLVQPAHVVGLQSVAELRGIRPLPDGALEIGATTTHRQVERAAEVRAYCPALAENFSRVATIRIRNQATIGGNLVHADPSQDPPPMLLALNAEAVIAGSGGERIVPLTGFFRDYFETSVEEGELLLAVRLPPLPQGMRATYIKFLPRTEDDYPTIAVAAALRLGSDQVCEDIRVGLGAAAPVPLRARGVEDALRGQRLTASLIEQAAELVRDEVDPLDDVRGSARYKREMARVWTGRALRSLLDGEPDG